MLKYKIYQDFLSLDDNKKLLDWATGSDEWNKSSIFSDDVKDWRKSNVIYTDVKSEPKVLIDKILKDLKIEFNNIEVQLTKSHDGDFYKPHNDIGSEGISMNRKNTFVYYMNKEPKQFLNGNLRIYESVKDDTDHRRYLKSKYTDIKPENNTLIVFPSHLWHEVLPVRCFMDWTYSRFTINGWFH